MGKYFSFIIIFLILLGCSNDLITSGNEFPFDGTDDLIESNWTIQKITKKFGTHDPFEIVPPEQVEEIIAGNVLVGEIIFNSDSTINITNASDEFYFNGLITMKWDYEDNFIKITNNSSGFGYKIIWYGNKQMKWYIESTGIEDGSKSVLIIDMQAI